MRCRRRCTRWTSAPRSARRPTCSGAAAKGAEIDAAKDPVEAIKRFREALNFLCEYSRDQKYNFRFALEAKPNEPRGHLYFPTTAAYLAFIPTLEHPDMVGVNPEVAHEHMAGPELLPCDRAGARGRQAVPHRSQRPEVRPLRSGSALRLRVHQGQLLRREAAGGLRLRRPAPLRRARVPHRGSGRRVGFRRAAACGPT